MNKVHVYVLRPKKLTQRRNVRVHHNDLYTEDTCTFWKQILFTAGSSRAT